MDNIEIINEELKRNQLHIDKHDLSFHINRILNLNKDIYSQIHILDIEQFYREINFGRTIAVSQGELGQVRSLKCDVTITVV